MGYETDLEDVGLDSETGVKLILIMVKWFSEIHERLPVGSTLVSLREEYGRRFVFDAVSAYFKFGGWMVHEGVDRGVFEFDDRDAELSDKSKVYQHMMMLTARGPAQMEGGPKVVSYSGEVEIEPFDKDELFERLVHGVVTMDEYSCYLARGDVQKLRDSLIEHDQVLEIGKRGDHIVRETIPPDDWRVTAYIDEDE